MWYESSSKYKNEFSEEKLRHIAIIMDGNRRWANKKGKTLVLGHKEGFKAAKKAVKFSIMSGFKILTLYAFSSENRERSAFEIKSLIKLFFFALDSEINNFNKYNIRLKIIGDIKYFNAKLQKRILQVEQMTIHNNGLILNIAINYGGRWDIVQSLKKIVNKVENGLLKIDQIKENTISEHLSTGELLPVDLVIRTGGEKRMSNFLLWEIAYSELYFTDILWPDFNHNSFQDAVNSFLSRERRFGGLKKI
ncbi:polyprenyl diphosphate synthase [Buchnera aphidicola]|uniref:Ditrans,polycis-undecaprenyl-diphosphate synthase ((2E,6E)-farnesyl-diphosphate specific) n=1 Tax=Buchnera aphidicola (Artemisaphis artemisicola) TaxID=1241836 RepID=A0A4D6XPQ0_9GAMM|nr:polyprenyl diphosphate synthase [Buchnera aphidicola]QCI15921.1 di-trans,poly-cis-decaprenylcistransferase [Buchnera aphidicola (Artemisaphis artemisicola)]